MQRDGNRPSGRRRRDWRVESLEPRQLLANNIISGFIYSDTNRDGIFDAGETAIANSPVVLRGADGTLVASTLTDANGRYQFSVPQILVTPTATTQFQVAALPVTPTASNRTVSLPQFNPALGTLIKVDVINQLILTDRVQAENFSSQGATLVAVVQSHQQITGTGTNPLLAETGDNTSFVATAYDGTSDFGGTSGKDFGLRTTTKVESTTISDQATLSQFIGTGTVSYTATADATAAVSGSGDVAQFISTSTGGSIGLIYHYLPKPVATPQSFTIVQTDQPSGGGGTYEPPGFTDGSESQGTTSIPNSIGTDTIPITLGSSDLPNNNFGEIPIVPPQPVSSLSGSVYLDTNNDGIRESNEFGIAHVAVTLTGTDLLGRAVTLQTTTADDGTYHFTGLLPGNYNVSEARTPAFREGKNRAGSLGGVVVKDLIRSVGVPAGAAGVQYNFGEVPTVNCRVNSLIGLSRRGITLPSGAIGPIIRYNLPTLVTALARPGLVAAARRARA